ncbi:MAG: N-6 DNA methylase [Ignavibacteria bacterium]|nr:N-6 DNA methylase [Ignavibacteria bacterium]
MPKANSIVRNYSKLCFIYPKTWMGSDSFSKYRDFIINNYKIEKIINLGYGIFENATVSTVITMFTKEKINQHKILLYQSARNVSGSIHFIEQENKLSYTQINSKPQRLFSFTKAVNIKIKTKDLIELVDFSLGIKTSNDKKFITNKKNDDETYPLLRGKNISRYSYQWTNEYIWYKPKLMMKKVGAGPRRLEYFLQDKILVQGICNSILRCTFDSNKYLVNDKVHLIFNPKKYSLKVILAILNSKFLSYLSRAMYGNYLEIKINQLEMLPFPANIEINFENKLNYLVDLRIGATDKLVTSIIENKIDLLVYKLYALTFEEVKIVDPEIEDIISKDEYNRFMIE